MPTCATFRADLEDCLAKSDCVTKLGLSKKECLDHKHNDSVDPVCRRAQRAFFECQIHLMNPRKRLRGPYAGSVSNPNSAKDEEPAAEAQSL